MKAAIQVAEVEVFTAEECGVLDKMTEAFNATLRANRGEAEGRLNVSEHVAYELAKTYESRGWDVELTANAGAYVITIKHPRRMPPARGVKRTEGPSIVTKDGAFSGSGDRLDSPKGAS